jgi:hypothetical protein
MSGKRRLEVRIPISPLDHYFNRIKFIALSIRTLGERYADTLIRVSVGADQEPEDLYRRLPWSRDLGVEWHWVDRAEFLEWKDTKHPYIATMMERFRPPFTAERVLMMDADVVVLRPFEELFALLEKKPGVVGVVGNISPFVSDKTISHYDGWRLLYDLADLGEPNFKFVHSSWGFFDTDPARKMSPPYFNTGVLLSTPSIFEKLYDTYMTMLHGVRANMDNYFFEQIALTLALERTRLPYHIVSMRFNFPNDPGYDTAYPKDFADIRFLHFLRNDVIEREQDFANSEATMKFIGRRDLNGSNELFRRRIEELAPLALQA